VIGTADREAVRKAASALYGSKYSSSGTPYLRVSRHAFLRISAASLRRASAWPDLPSLSPFRMALMAASGAVWVLPCKFDLVFKKNGLLLGAFGEGEVVKLYSEFLAGSGRNRRAENLDDLVRGESDGVRAAEAAGIRVPTIRGRGDSPMRYVRQELVPSRKPSKDASTYPSLAEAVLREIDKFYRTDEVDFLPLSAMPASREAAARLRNGLAAMEEANPDLAEFARENLSLLESPFVTAEVPAHGDLCRGNILLDPAGAICLCDWERYGRTLFGYDAFTLVASLYPDGASRQAEMMFADPSASPLGPNAVAILRESSLRNGMDPAECGRTLAVANFLVFLAYMSGAPDNAALGRHLEMCNRSLAR
jgi:hypothetical protein